MSNSFPMDEIDRTGSTHLEALIARSRELVELTREISDTDYAGREGTILQGQQLLLAAAHTIR